MSGRPRWSASSFGHEARGAVRFVPVSLRGELVGYLWAAKAETAAGFMRRLDGPEATFLASLVWFNRLDDACTQGLHPLEALRKWRGAPEHPEGGGIAADAPEEEAESKEVLGDRFNPGHVDPLKDFSSAGPILPDGTPVFGSAGAKPLSAMKPPECGYPSSPGGPVRYLPVRLGGRTVGYLWAAVTDDAAYFVPRGDAGELGKNAGVAWVLRLREAEEEGTTPLQALRGWRGAPEDRRSGAIPADAEEREAPSVRALLEMAAE